MRTWIAGMTIAAAFVLVSAAPAWAQAAAQTTGTIAGTVLDEETQRPLLGAQVSIPGTSLGALVDRDGRFTVSGVPAGEATVRVERIGYGANEQTVTVPGGGTAVVNFALQPQAVSLEELVVVGYGTQRREDLTGAVSSVTSDKFIQAPARDAASLIAGKIAGLSVTSPSGDPRDGTEIMLRGVTTINGPRNPLILVDGVPGGLETVAPQDIESIDVLKDGSAAAVYGSRASNGVIFITTKKYQGGSPTIRYEGYASYQTLYNQPDFLDAVDYRRLIGEGFDFEDLGSSTDWQDQVLRNPMSYNHNLTITGGASNTNYVASLSYENGQGIFERSNNRELTGRVNVGHTMYDGRLQADLNLLTRVENFFTGPNYDYAWRQTLIRNPTDQVRDDAGAWQERGTYFYTNPAGLINEDNGEQENRSLRMHGTLTFRPLDNLRLSLLGGTERGSSIRGSATTFRHVNTTQSGQNGTASRSTDSDVDRILEVTGTYLNNINGHDFTLLGGYSYQDFVDEGFSTSTFDFPTDLFGYNQLQRGNALSEGEANISSNKESYKVIGFFSRLNYDWNNRFLLMGSLRYEGNSRFGADHKWGLFPAVSAGWRLSQESFLQNSTWIDDLKLRAGYGVTGIAPGDSYLSLTSYDYGARFLYDGRWVQGIEPSRNPNPDLRWERKEEINVGVDFSLFDFRLAGSLDVYRRDTRDMLYQYSVPVPPYLENSILANVGHMRNRGIEAQLTYDVVRASDLRWTTSANWSTNSNRLVSLSNDVFQPEDDWFTAGYTGEPIQLPTHRVDIGGPIGNFYGFESVDIDENGEWIVLNSEGEQISINDVSEDDRRILGNGIPDHYVAWNNAVQFRNIDLSVNMRGAFGHQILNFQRMFYENPSILEYNMLETAFDPVYGKRTVDYDLSYVSYYIEDGDYWKVDNVTLGYTFDTNSLPLMSNVLSGARIYVSGRNLLTLTGYKGLDPEVSLSGLDPGNDFRDKYPTTRFFTAGVSVTF
ncbi:MAG: SusC/RagA family TonB-linked outer membrane protein [Longimicrobiales bacterium]